MIATDILESAFTNTKKLLLPFTLKKWLLLAVIVLFAGGIGFSVPNVNAPFSEVGMPDLSGLLPLLIPIALVSIMIGLALFYVRSIFDFVLFDSASAAKVHIKRSFNEYHEQGMSRFWYGLGLAVAFIAGAAIFGGLTWVLVQNVSWAASIPVIVIGGIVALALFLFDWFVRALVLPGMYLEKSFVMPMLRRMLKQCRGRWAEVIVYFVMIFVLGLVLGLLLVFAMFLIVLITAIIVGMFALVGFLLFQLSPILLVPLIVIGVLLAIPLLIVVCIAFLFATIPVRTFLANYSLAFTARLLKK